MGNLEYRIKKANAAFEKTHRPEQIPVFTRVKLGVMSDEEKSFREQNPDYQGKVLIITWHDRNAIDHDDSCPCGKKRDNRFAKGAI